MSASPETERRPSDAPAAPSTRGLTLRVCQVVEETADAVSLVFDVPEPLCDRFSYRPGQFLTLRIPSDLTGSVARCYSLASSPLTGEPLRVTVKRTAGGFASNWICDNVVAGSELVVLPPSGAFVPRVLDGDYLLFAAGSGITPVMSILTSALVAGAGLCTLFYANRDRDATIFRGRLDELELGHPERLTVHHWLEDAQGLPTREAIASVARAHPEAAAFACGPGPFMDLVRGAFHDLGRTVRTENFVSLARNPFDEPMGSDLVDDSDPAGRVAQVSVDLFGEQAELDWPEQERLLDVLIEGGLDAPYACREATCSSCVCRVVQGEVRMVSNETLDPEEIAEGYVLACQALPLSDQISISYD